VRVREEINAAMEGVPQQLARMQRATQASSKAATRLTKTTRTVRSASQQRLLAQPDQPLPSTLTVPEFERRELALAKKLGGAVDLLLSRCAEAGVDPTVQPRTWLTAFEGDVARIMRDLWIEGAQYAIELQLELTVCREVRKRYESIMRVHGLPIPTDPQPRPPEDE
jgi:hypothetical protein